MKSKDSSESRIHFLGDTPTSVDKDIYDQVVEELNKAKAGNIPNHVEYVIKKLGLNRLLVQKIVQRESRRRR